MTGLYLGIACALAPVAGVFLRLMAFMDRVGDRRQLLLKITSAGWICVHFFLNIYMGLGGRLTVAFYKESILAFGIATTATNMLIIRKYFREQIFTFGLTALFVVLVYAVAAFIAGNVTGGAPEDVLLFGNILGFAIFMALFPQFKKIIVGTVVPFLDIEAGNYWNTMWLIPLAILFGTAFSTGMNSFITTVGELAMRLCIGAATILLCRSVAADFQLFREREQLLTQVGQQKEHYEAMAEKVRAERRERHDFKHQLAAVRNMINEGKLDELLAYCGEAEEALSDIANAPHTGNAAADSLLYHYASLAGKEGISFSVDGSFGESTLPDGDLICLLGNALDNAMTAVRTADGEKFIRCAIMNRDGQLMITVDNSFDGTVLFEDGKYYSRKRHHEEGIGISSMRGIVEKYNGVSRFTSDGNVFEASFMMDVRTAG